MRIQSIKGYNNSLSFGNIYIPKNADFTENQRKIVTKIVDALIEPSPKLNNKSPNEFYKSDSGIDFCISKYDSQSDSVCLQGYKGVKTVGTGVDEAITYDNSFRIGIYDEENPFKLEDIETGIKNVMTNNLMFLLPTLTFIAAMLSIIGLSIANRHSTKPEKQIKPLIEQVDTLVNKTTSSDTAKFGIW